MEKQVRSKEQLSNDAQVWNEILDYVSSLEFPICNDVLNDLYIFIISYNELESGGHEGLLNWNADLIRTIGIENFSNTFVTFLKKIEANELANIEEQYIKTCWKLFNELEDGLIEEDAFYDVIEAVDNVYFKQSDLLRQLVQQYFNKIYKDIFIIKD